MTGNYWVETGLKPSGDFHFLLARPQSAECRLVHRRIMLNCRLRVGKAGVNQQSFKRSLRHYQPASNLNNWDFPPVYGLVSRVSPNPEHLAGLGYAVCLFIHDGPLKSLYVLVCIRYII